MGVSVSSAAVYLLALVATAATIGAAERARPAREQPNVVYVFSDEHRWHSMSFTEQPGVRTPNIARLAREGMSFSNSISNYPLCTPHRAMLMTGRWPYQIHVKGHPGVTGNNVHLNPSQMTIARAFGGAEYVSGYIGKWHLGGSDAREFGFDESLVWLGTMGHWSSSFMAERRVHSTRYNATHMTDQALEFIERNAGSPFLLMLSFDPPHEPMEDAPPEMLALYADRGDLPDRPNYVAGTVAEGAVHELVREVGVEEAIRRLAKTKDESKARRQVRRARREIEGEETPDRLHWKKYRGYHAHVSAVDAELGRLLDKLDELDLSNDTIVVYSSDHGSMLGSHGLSNKSFPYEESIRTPFVARWPQHIPAGETSAALLGTIDVLPTLCSLAGVDVPDGCAGQSFASTLRGQPGPEPSSQFLMHISDPVQKSTESRYYRGVRTARHTYAVADTGPWLLFDNVADPYQNNNLVADPDFAELRKQLRAEIAGWLKQANDPFVLRD